MLAVSVGVYALAGPEATGSRRAVSRSDASTVPSSGSGKRDEAVRELEAWAADRQLLPAFWPTVNAPLVQERLGELYEALGRRADAAAAYEQVVEIWKDADAVLQPRVERARQKAQALRATP